MMITLNVVIKFTINKIHINRASEQLFTSIDRVLISLDLS